MAKIHCHSLLSGSSWSSFDEDSSEEEPEAMEVDENNAFGLSEATRLRKEDMNLYGLCPAQEDVCLVICKECANVVKLSSFTRHYDLLHREAIPQLTPSPELDASATVDLMLDAKTSLSDEAIKIEKLEVEDSSVKIEEVPLTVPKVNHVTPALKILPAVKKISSSNKKSPRKVIPTREREFDADKHCGVWVQDQQKRCTRSLTCKTHALSLRRAVPGRRKKFDELLAEHKARVNCEKEQQQQQNLSSLKSLESKALEKNNVMKGNACAVKIEPSSKLSNDKHQNNIHPNVVKETVDSSNKVEVENEDTEESLLYNELTTLNHHPKPLATCSFGGRKVGHGALAFNRRQDHLRCAMLTMVEKYLNPSAQRHASGRPGAAAILHRPAVKTIGQSSNHGLFKGSSVVGDKVKSHSSHRNLSNFLKAPPPPRNRSVKHNNVVKHSVDNSTVYQTSNVLHSKHNYTTDSSTTTKVASSSDGFFKPDASSQAISDMGNIIASIDSNVSQSLNIGQNVTKNSRTLTGNFPSGATLDSSLNLCSNLGLNSEVSNQGTRTAYTTIFTTINNSSVVQTSAGSIKEIMPAPVVAKVNGSAGSGILSSSGAMVQLSGHLDPNTVKVSASSAGQRESPLFFSTQNAVTVASSLPNGAGPSPPPIATGVKGYPALSFVIQGSKGATNQSAVSFPKGHSLVFNSMGMAQMQQPSSPLQQQQQTIHQKGKVLLRANSYPKTSSKTNNPQIKIPKSPSPQLQQQLSPGLPQTKTIIVTSPPPGKQNLYLNHQHMANAPQPIVQLKQQVEQQQQQLQQITLQQQLQQQQLQQQQLQQHKQMNSQFAKQLPIQPRLAPAPHPPSQSIITQQQLAASQNIVIKATDQPLKSPQSTVYVTSDSHPNIQASVVHNKPQSNVA